MLLDLTSSVVSIPVSPWCESNPNCYANQTYFPNESTTPAEIAMCTSQCSYCGEIAVRGGTYLHFHSIQPKFIQQISFYFSSTK